MTDVRTLLADAVRTGWPARERKDAKRIRELEAELLDQKKGYDELWLKNRKAEARVAELEDALKACIDETPAMWVREKEED